MATLLVKRPRNVNAWRAAAVLYGDWGTSKAYVLGLAFALAGYSSFWYILAVSILTVFVGISYIFICKSFPTGGGVYSSVRSRSKVVAILGAFFLISDYLVTASLSALSAFHYIGLSNPEYWAILSIGIIGLLNFLGPKHTGSIALLLAIPTVIVIILLGALSLPFLPEAVRQLQPISHHALTDWKIFVGIIVALSGIESIANTTSTMKLNPGTTEQNPSVTKTSTPAILVVMLEVCLFTALLGLAMNALPGLTISGEDVNAPGFPNVRDAMLRYMGDIFGSSLFGPEIGQFFAYAIMIVIALLLLSAVNTALTALISLLFIMARDEELPHCFQILNKFGSPIYATVAAFLLPIAILIFVHDISGLANLYAIGFVGAITVNLAATATNFTLPLQIWQRLLMLFTFAIMACIEITLFIDKPKARIFVITIISIGLLLRAIAAERREKAPEVPAEKLPLPEMPPNVEEGMMVAVTGVSKSLDYALKEAEIEKSPLYILFIREQPIVTERDSNRHWTDDSKAREVYEHIKTLSPKFPTQFLYLITSNIADSIVEIAKEKKVRRVFLGKKKGILSLVQSIKGTSATAISSQMPPNIDLVVVF